MYESNIRQFVTFLSRCPLRQSKNDGTNQSKILHDFTEIIVKLNNILIIKWSDKRKTENRDSSLTTKPSRIIKHLQKVNQEILNNISIDIINQSANECLEVVNKLFLT